MLSADGSTLIPAALVIVIMMVVAMVGAGVVSIAVERFAYRPLRYAPRIAPLISALGVSFILQNLVQITVSPRPLSYGSNTLIGLNAGVTVGDLKIHASRILVIGVTLVLMLGLTYFVQQTRLGRAMRAVSTDLDAAEMMGVDVNRVVLATFLSARCWRARRACSSASSFQHPSHDGFIAGLKGFTAAVVGGIGSIRARCSAGLSWAWPKRLRAFICRRRSRMRSLL